MLQQKNSTNSKKQNNSNKVNSTNSKKPNNSNTVQNNSCNNSVMCPITLNTKKDILNNGRKVFSVPPVIYDADELKKWVDAGNLEYPHNRSPISQNDLDRLNNMLGITADTELTHDKMSHLDKKMVKDIPGNVTFYGRDVKIVILETVMLIFHINPETIKFSEWNTPIGDTTNVGLIFPRAENFKRDCTECEVSLSDVYYLKKDPQNHSENALVLLFKVKTQMEETWVMRAAVYMKASKKLDIDANYYKLAPKKAEEQLALDQQRKPVYLVRDADIQKVNKNFDISRQGGGAKAKHNNRSYNVHTGARGGKYIIVKGEKKYL